ncbi:uncharacterized protein LOC119446043 isoform X6 [Dermacentor silvarum]|uniref:uncharacterized protein LOC119446043 isoform X6 n=1 Tax=Dermacentor silvarum TaxID=543639 RepID=UPI00210120BB|nr:uncharacterized protein LOC119446043 isoform X6 [Dermacentor silvarum]
MSSTMLPVKYNVRWGHSSKSNHSSLMNQSDMFAKYKKKVRAVLQKNRLLAKALGDAKARISELEGAGSRQQKIDNLALPQIKLWLETNLQHMHTMVTNHSRAIKLLQDIMTPGLDITLAGISDLDLSTVQERRQSLHPPGRQYYDEFGNITVILEEDETTMVGRSEQPQDSGTNGAEPEPELCSKVTVRRKSRRTRSSAGRRASLSDEPADSGSEPVVPTFKVVDQEASILLTEVTGQEKTVVCAESVVLPPPDKVKGPSVNEYSAAFSYRPKIPRTPNTVNKDTSPYCYEEDICSSPVQTRQRQRPSETPLQPWPRKSETLHRNSRSTRRSGLAEPIVSNSSSPLQSASLLECAFVESPTSTPPSRGSDPAVPEEAVPIDDTALGEQAPRKRTARKSCISRASDARKSSRVTFVVSKVKESMAARQEGPRDSMPVTADSEDAKKSSRATFFVDKVKESVAARQEGPQDSMPVTADSEDAKKSSRATFFVDKVKKSMAARQEGPRDSMPITVDSEEPPKEPSGAPIFVCKKEKMDARLEGLGDAPPRTTNSEEHHAEGCGSLPQKEKSDSENIGATEQKEASQKAARLSKQARRTGKKSRDKPRDASPAETGPPQRSGSLLKPEPMDVGAGSSTDEDGAPRSSTSRPSRRKLQPKSYKEPSIMTKLRRP